jgi:PPP family 3-phenylpropionic acid transporter
MIANRTGVPLRLLYFLFFIAMGSSGPFASIFLKRVLVNGSGKPAIELIGILYTILPFVGILATMSASLIADKFHLGRKIIAYCCIIAGLSAIVLGQSAEPWTILWPLEQRFIFVLVLLLVYGFGTGPINGLLDAETLHFLNVENAREKYGTYRLWGTYGWFVSTIAMGVLLTQFHDLAFMYYGTAAGCLMLGIATLFRMSKGEVPKLEKIPFNHLGKNRRFQVFLVYMFMYGVIYNMTFSYLGYFFDDVMQSFWQMGLIFGTWTIFEIPVMMFSHKLIRRFGNRRLIVIGLALNAVRLILFGTFTLQTPYAYKFLVALLQGPGYAFTQIGFIDYIDRQAHHNMRATYLNAANIAQNTIGASVGGIIGSVIIRQLGSTAMFSVSGFAIIGLTIFFWGAVKSERIESVQKTT